MLDLSLKGALCTLFVYITGPHLINDVVKLIRNFMWSGDKDQRKLIIVSRKKIYRLLQEGGWVVDQSNRLTEHPFLHILEA